MVYVQLGRFVGGWPTGGQSLDDICGGMAQVGERCDGAALDLLQARKRAFGGEAGRIVGGGDLYWLVVAQDQPASEDHLLARVKLECALNLWVRVGDDDLEEALGSDAASRRRLSRPCVSMANRDVRI
jgi:hypothetical protein